MIDVEQIAQKVDDAARMAQAIPQISHDDVVLSLQQAYDIQGLSIARRIARGEAVVGIKMGFTSRAKMVQMEVHDQIWGRLTDAMQVEDGGEVSLTRFIHPRIEPEVAFLLKEPLHHKMSLQDVTAAVAAVAPALEIIDSRYQNFKFSLTDVVADNSSSSAFVIGPWTDPMEDLSNLGLVMSFDGGARQIGSTAAILGNPYRSLVAAARLADAAGLTLRPGFIVLAGAATAAEVLPSRCHVSLEMQSLGRVEISSVD